MVASESDGREEVEGATSVASTNGWTTRNACGLSSSHWDPGISHTVGYLGFTAWISR